jgi:NAD(P)-dependent dehydrogenase (short-subunit alcohol dehydrogenase family)
MDLGLAGKRALVTGGSRGLGRAVARQLALEGCEVVVAARSEERLREAARDLATETGGRVEPVVFDLMDAESIRDCVDRAVDLLGGLDIVVAAAARTGGHGEEADVYATASEPGMIADFEEKVVGSLRLARAVEPHLRAAGGGRIVLFSGGAGRVRGGLISAGARNRAANHLAVSLANALGRYGIGCVSVAPSFAVTERQMDAHRRAAERSGIPLDEYIADRAGKTTLMRRLVMAEDLAKVVCFLCSPVSWPINAANIELAGGSSPDIRYELEPHPPWERGTAI